jgi:hypothetical protein
MEWRNNYILYICYNDVDIFLADLDLQKTACRKYEHIKAYYVEKTDKPLMEREEFKKVLEKMDTGKYVLLIYKMNVLGYDNMAIMKLMDYWQSKNIYILQAENEILSKHSQGFLSLRFMPHYQKYIKYEIGKTFLVSTGKGVPLSGYDCCKGSINNPISILKFLNNEDNCLQVFSLSTLKKVYEFSSKSSLFENKCKIYNNIKILFESNNKEIKGT